MFRRNDESTGGIVSYFAAAAVRGANGWAATELDLDGAADVEEVADRLRDEAPDAAVSLLFVESDDAYLVIMRLDEGEDLRIFGSDAAFAEESRLGALLLGEVEESTLNLDDELSGEEAESNTSDSSGLSPDAEPVGDPDLLSDLGVPAARIVDLCTREGMLPSDVTAEVCQALGCGDEVEELREA